MARPQSAFWAQPGKAGDEVAAALLDRWRPAILRRIEWYEVTYPFEVDWDSVVWMAAYRAAYAYRDGYPFWPLLKLCIERASTNPLARRYRRNVKLQRVAINLDERLYYRERWDMPEETSDGQ